MLAELQRRLLEHTESVEPAMHSLSFELWSVLGVDHFMAYTLNHPEDGSAPTCGDVIVPSKKIMQTIGKDRLKAMIDHSLKRKLLFDPSNPPPQQQNKAKLIPFRSWHHKDPRVVVKRIRSYLSEFGHGDESASHIAELMLEDYKRHIAPYAPAGPLSQVRILVCDPLGSRVLAWIGGFSVDCSDDQVTMLDMLARALQDRITLEYHQRALRCADALITETLAHLPYPAFIVNAAGQAAWTNKLGRAVLDSPPWGKSGIPVAALKSNVYGPATVTHLRDEGLPKHRVITLHWPRLKLARLTWKLGARETEVLERLVEGDSYKEIGGALGIEARTVETHVRRIFKKVKVKNKMQLARLYWQLSPPQA